MSELPFSQSCENNKHVILVQLQRWFATSKRVLEVGSGTGQHAVHFAEGLPHLVWQCSDQAQYHDGINRWIDEASLDNLRRPLAYKVGQDDWPNQEFDAVFSANTAHIMQKDEAKLLMQQVSENLPIDGVFCQYGPFTLNGEFSSQSNADFHQRLLLGGYGGYRDINELIGWAKMLSLKAVVPMPANNLLLVWHKK